MIRRFKLVRPDVSGVSGTGHVADSVIWPDGTASVRWRGEHPSTVTWDGGQAAVEYVHGHGGSTEIVWLDPEPPEPAPTDLGWLKMEEIGARWPWQRRRRGEDS